MDAFRRGNQPGCVAAIASFGDDPSPGMASRNGRLRSDAVVRNRGVNFEFSVYSQDDVGKGSTTGR
jgi:hypothetical protein